jgi:hypothetical protein
MIIAQLLIPLIKTKSFSDLQLKNYGLGKYIFWPTLVHKGESYACGNRN